MNLVDLPRFNLGDLDELLPPLPASESSTNGQGPKQAAAGLIFNPDAQPPDGKFALLCEIDPKFLLTWNHQHDDLNDTSQSGHDLSLAVRAVDAGWKDQEILDLLIANRRMFHGKRVSDGYFLRTIARARAAVLRRQEEAEQAEAEEPASNRRAALGHRTNGRGYRRHAAGDQGEEGQRTEEGSSDR